MKRLKDLPIQRKLTLSIVLSCAAALFLVAQALIGLAVLLTFNRFSIGLGLASLIVVAIYPLTKRVTPWPQAALGLAFSWGALMGWSARFGALGSPALLLYAAAFCWTDWLIWLMAPFLRLGLPALVAARVVMALSALVFRPALTPGLPQCKRKRDTRSGTDFVFHTSAFVRVF